MKPWNGVDPLYGWLVLDDFGVPVSVALTKEARHRWSHTARHMVVQVRIEPVPTVATDERKKRAGGEG